MTATMHQFKLPDLGEGVHEGQIIRIHVAAGQSIREDDPLLEVETDKAAVEITSPVTGLVSEVHVGEQDLVHVGDVMVTFAPDEPASSSKTPAAPAARSPATPAPPAPAARRHRPPASPSVRRLARERGLDLHEVRGSGPGGRVTRADLEQAPTPPPEVLPETTPVTTSQVPVPAARISPPPSGPTTEIEGIADTDQYGAIVRQNLSQARRTISRVMQTSWQTIPHVTDCNDADITELEAMRRSFTDTEHPQRRITTLAFVIRAVCRAIRKHPILNASIDVERDEIVFHEYVNVGVGVDTPRGLIAPVIRNAHLMGVGELSDHLAVMTHNTRSGAFGVEDTRGATYTISNAGAMGRTRYSTPIIAPGTVACLAMGRAQMMPWIVDGQVVPRLILPLSHSMDHRLVDGGREVPFIGHVIDDLEHPMRFAL
jgi:pyruvate/2-oxoglutarate dehydrogenase complex dihydrolipoamide acyltransferase (E2) component